MKYINADGYIINIVKPIFQLQTRQSQMDQKFHIIFDLSDKDGIIIRPKKPIFILNSGDTNTKTDSDNSNANTESNTELNTVSNTNFDTKKISYSKANLLLLTYESDDENIDDNCSNCGNSNSDGLNKIYNDNVHNLSGKNVSQILEKIGADINANVDDIDSAENDIIDFEISDDENDACYECGEKDTLIEDTTKGIIVCTSCGSINQELIDESPEWRQYNNDDSKSDYLNRCGGPNSYFLPKSSLGTSIAGSCYGRLKTIQKWNSMVYKERSLNSVLEGIIDKCTKYGIQKIIIDDAKIMYKKLSECKYTDGKNKGRNIIFRGNNRKSLIAACVFISCIKNKNPLNPKEVAKMFDLHVTRITKGCKQLYRLMKTYDEHNIFDDVDTSNPEFYIARYCKKLNVPASYCQVAVDVSKNCTKLKIASDHTPQSVAAGSILIMVDYKKLGTSKKYISELFKISEVTISKIYRKMAEYKNILLDNNATDHLAKKYGFITQTE